MIVTAVTEDSLLERGPIVRAESRSVSAVESVSITGRVIDASITSAVDDRVSVISDSASASASTSGLAPDSAFPPHVSISSRAESLLSSSLSALSVQAAPFVPSGISGANTSDLASITVAVVPSYPQQQQQQQQQTTNSNYAYFYQAMDGELVFLHSLSFKPLFLEAHQDYTKLPLVITGNYFELLVTPRFPSSLDLYLFHFSNQSTSYQL